MLAHRLRHRVTFQALTVAVDDDGYRTEQWRNARIDGGMELVDVPAEVLTGPGKEFIASGATQAETSARINLRWFPANERDMAAWRVIWDGRTYNITSAETDITARREWRLRVTDGPGEGQ